MLDNHHHLYNKDTHSSYFWWCCHGPIACPVNKESYYTAVNVSLCFVMFTRHKLSMTMRQFILLELSTVHPSPIQQIANNSNFSQRNPKRWHSFYSGTNEVKHKKATSHSSGIVVFFLFRNPARLHLKFPEVLKTFIFHNHKDWIFNFPF